MNAYQRIQKAMRDRDRDLLREIKRLTLVGDSFSFIGEDKRTLNSLGRLADAGKIKYSKRRHGYVEVVK